MKRRCLFIGDGVVPTGFARMNHAYIDGLLAAGFDVHMLALNHKGDPAPQYPYPIYPSARVGCNDGVFGVGRTAALVRKVKPDVICITQDPWNFRSYLLQIRGVDKSVPVVGSVAVDGLNCRGAELGDFTAEFQDGRVLAYRGLETAVFWTQFGLDQARLGGYEGDAEVIPLGVDVDIYKPCDKQQSRRMLAVPDRLMNSFCVGYVGRNQWRKRVDALVSMFAEWVHTREIPDAALLLYPAPTGDKAWDLEQLGSYYEIADRLLIFVPELGVGVSEREMAPIYSAFDVFATASQAEGWNLPQMEAMACGVPTLCPGWAALSEWPEDAALRIPCTDTTHTTNGINSVGGLVDRKEFIEGLDKLYRDRALREALSTRGLALVNRPCFRWQAIGAEFARVCEEAIHKNKGELVLVTDIETREAVA